MFGLCTSFGFGVHWSGGAFPKRLSFRFQHVVRNRPNVHQENAWEDWRNKREKYDKYAYERLPAAWIGGSLGQRILQ